MKKTITKIIRILTVAPVMALATLCTLFIARPHIFGGTHLFVISTLFLLVLPICAYPLQPVIPGFNGKGREGQRNLAMVFAVSGYVAGCITNLFLSAPVFLWMIYLDYLISGALVVIINKVFKLRASAHACGIAGPAALLCYCGLPLTLIPAVRLYFAALWASIEMKRHTIRQFLGGALIPLAVLGVLHLILV